MRAMILAAGRGERLRPITDTTPKPLVEVAGQPLIFHHLDALTLAGFRHITVNVAHLAPLIIDALGDGSRWGAHITISQEPEGALETGGGIAQALPDLGESPFAVINGDVFTDFPMQRLRSVKCDIAHLVMVSVPPNRKAGDFHLNAGLLEQKGDPLLTFSGISVYHPRFFQNCPAGRWSIVPRLREAMDRQQITGEHYQGQWYDVGTPEMLETLRSA